jgi:hypothetical protein
MSAFQALKRLRRLGLLTREQSRQIKALMRSGAPFPPHLESAAELIFLVQTLPPTLSLH